MQTGLATADYAILVSFFLVLLAVGVFYANRMRDLKDFFSGSSQVPWWLSGISLYMTTFSAFAFVSYSELAYKYGFVAVAVWWLTIPACLISARFVAARWRRAVTTSPLEFLEVRYGPVLRQCFSWFGIPLIVLDDALKLFVIGAMTAVLMGYDGPWGVSGCIAVCGSAIALYTLLGGLWAVLITDFIQFVVMGTAVIVLAPLAWLRAGGAASIVQHLPSRFSDITVGDYTWPWLIAFGVILALTFATKWPYVQRYYAARTDAEAARVGYLVAALTALTPLIVFFPALAARSFLPEIADTKQVYSIVCRELLPAGMMGMMLAAMFSATMSMLSSDYNAVASVITNDILKRTLMPNAGDRTLLLTARLSTLAVALTATVLAMLFAQAETLEDLVQYMAQLFAALLPPVALPMIAGLISRRTSNRGALCGFALGAACGIAVYVGSYHGELAYLRSIPYLTWITLLPTAAGLVAGSMLLPDSAGKRLAVGAFLDGLRSEHGPRTSLLETREARVALRIIGGTTLALGLVLALSVAVTQPWGASTLSIGVGLAMMLFGCAGVWLSRRDLAASRSNA